MSDYIWAIESTPSIGIVQGHKPRYGITFNGATTVSDGGIEIYKNGSGSNIAVTLSMTDGTMAYSGNILVLPTLQNFIGGNEYVVVVTATVDGIVEVHKFQLTVQRPRDKR